MKRRIALLLTVVFSSLLSVTIANGKEARIDTQVVAIFSTNEVNSYFKPWRSPNFRSVRGSGFFFECDHLRPKQKGLILTNAHVAAATQNLEISNGKEKKRYAVEPLAIYHQADIAVLQMPDKERQDYERRNGKIIPLKLGNSDELRVGDEVRGWGYPLGGERISKSEQGEISRIEIRRYAYSHEKWLMIQASLQQNPGNSGGPILKDGKVVGIAFQGVMASDRINYFIPINLVKHLLPLLDRQDQIPRWRYFAQELSPQLKTYYNLDKDHGGILLNSLIPEGGPDKYGLKANDIILKIEGHDIDNYGDIFYEPLNQRIYFEEIIHRKKVGVPLNITVSREGKLLDIAGVVTPGRSLLVPKIFTNANYFIFGGIGFVELTSNAIATMGKAGASLREKYLRELPKTRDEKIVMIAEIFPEYQLINTGPFIMERVEKINDQKVLNIAMLYATILSMKERGEKKALIRLGKNRQLPLSLVAAATLDKKIKEEYGILYMKTPGDFY